MPEQDLIDVRVLVDGQPLEEHRESEATEEGIQRIRYVEVKAGQEFAIQICWKTGFDLNWAEALSYIFWVDKLPFCAYVQEERKDIHHRRGTLIKDVSETGRMVSLKNEIAGEWERFPYTFGVL